MSNPTDLDLACQAWREAKAAEDAARLARVDAEQKIIELAGVKEEGSRSTKTTYFKLTTTGKLLRSLDAEAYSAIRSQIPGDIEPVDWKPSLNLKRLREIESSHPDLYARVAQCITTKPAKPAIKVELLTQ